MEEKKHTSSDEDGLNPPTDTGVIVMQPYGDYIKPQARGLHDPSITFAEYHHYAALTREEEKSIPKPKLRIREVLDRKPNDPARKGSIPTNVNFTDQDLRVQISDEEWANASRALRTASTGACFYLITTDILGPYGIGFALGTLGWGPGIVIFTIFAFFAGYSGHLVCRVFLGTDSHQFPVRNYGDLALRTWGNIARHVVNVLQALGLLLILGQVVIQYGQNISEVSKYRLCYVVCPLIFVLVGFVLGQIRTLRNFGYIANLSVWLTLLTIFISMGTIAHSEPNFAIATLGSAGSFTDPTTITPVNGVYPPVIHYNNIPPGNGLIGAINGVLSGVLAYAGVQFFVEFLAEMRRPTDFYKAMWGAQLFIFVTYIVYGSFVYYYQGQYSFQPSYLGVSSYGFQTAGNMLSIIAALIAACLYGNIGVKVLYNNVLMELFNAPPLITKWGKIFYAILVPIWWTIAFVIAASIPDYVGFVSVISASCLLNLTYTIPPFLALGFDIQKNSIIQQFDPHNGHVVHETGVRRWVYGFFRGGPKQVVINVWHALIFLCALGMSGLGMYAAVEGMVEAFKNPQLTSWTCTSPLNLNG